MKIEGRGEGEEKTRDKMIYQEKIKLRDGWTGEGKMAP